MNGIIQQVLALGALVLAVWFLAKTYLPSAQKSNDKTCGKNGSCGCG